MPRRLALAALSFTALAAAAVAAPSRAPTRNTPSVAEIVAASKPAEWRRIDPENLLYMDLPSGRVVIELAPGYAPHHAANIRALARAGYFDNAAITRSQENYVVQWGQPDEHKPTGAAKRTLKAEFERRIGRDVPFDAIPDRDTYAPEVGFSQGFPAARDRKAGLTWLVHCYGMVGAGRDLDVDSGNGGELYANNGQSPRNLDRNVTLVGRVIQGMDKLAIIPRGTGDLGFYKTEAERTPIQRIRVAADVPAAERVDYEALRTDSASFRTLLETRRHRHDDFYKYASGHIGVCNAPLPVRVVGAK